MTCSLMLEWWRGVFWRQATEIVTNLVNLLVLEGCRPPGVLVTTLTRELTINSTVRPGSREQDFLQQRQVLR